MRSTPQIQRFGRQGYSPSISGKLVGSDSMVDAPEKAVVPLDECLFLSIAPVGKNEYETK